LEPRPGRGLSDVHPVASRAKASNRPTQQARSESVRIVLLLAHGSEGAQAHLVTKFMEGVYAD
jgi:hypothetical protein